MRTFLAEVYAPAGRDELPETAARLRLVAAGDARVRVLRSMFVPEDETLFLVLEATSARAVRHIGERANVTLERVAEVANQKRKQRKEETRSRNESDERRRARYSDTRSHRRAAQADSARADGAGSDCVRTSGETMSGGAAAAARVSYR